MDTAPLDAKLFFYRTVRKQTRDQQSFKLTFETDRTESPKEKEKRTTPTSSRCGDFTIFVAGSWGLLGIGC